MSRTRSVLELVTRMNIGGPARLISALRSELADDFDIHLAAGRPQKEEGTWPESAAGSIAVPLVRRMSPILDASAILKVHSLTKDLHVQVLHTHMAKAGAVGRFGALLSRGRPRLVHTFHGHVLDSYFGNASQRLFLETERILARHTDILIAVSMRTRDDLLAMGIGRPHQFRVIRVGIDLSPFLEVDRPIGQLRRHLGVAADTMLAGMVGRLVPVKDHATALRALRHVPNLHLAIVGGGELREAIERQAELEGIRNRVHFAGWWSDIPGALSDLDLVLSTSVNEGTPLSMIEALAAARPVVATDVGGVGEIVVNGFTGYLCPPQQPLELANAIVHTLENREGAHQLALAGRQHVTEHYALSHTLNAHRSLYDELLSS